MEANIMAVFDWFYDTLACTLSEVWKKNNTIPQKLKSVSLYDGSSLFTKLSLLYFVHLQTPLDQWGEGFYTYGPSLL